jgi:hypothetical protein
MEASMTVENDGLSPIESAAHEPDESAALERIEAPALDPSTDMLPLDGAIAREAAATDAAAWQAELGAPVTTPPRTSHITGDLFDDQG